MPGKESPSELVIDGNLNQAILIQDIAIENTKISTVGQGNLTLNSNEDIRLNSVTSVVISASPLRMASFTTELRDTIVPQYGDMIYNTSTNKFQGYAKDGISSGVDGWVDLH